MATPNLLPNPMQLELISLTVDHATGDLTSVAASRTAEAACSLCQQKTCRLHSRFKRKWADLPIGGQALRWLVEVRRFRCQNPDCTRKIFCERLPTCAPAYARRTVRATEVLIAIAFALGGRAGAKLVEDLNMPMSHDILLIVVNEAADALGGIGVQSVICAGDQAWFARPSSFFPGFFGHAVERARLVWIAAAA
jgi:transposase